MRFPVYVFQFPDGIVCIDLSGCQTTMAQQFLDGIQVCPLIHEMGGKCVSEHMGTFFV